jgi:hypothetical protein
MIGGIFLEIPFGEIYKVEKVSRIRTNLNRLLGFSTKYFTKGNFDKELVESIFQIAKTSLGKHRGDVRREHYSRSGDLIRSTAMGVYLDGKLKSEPYRFTGGPDHEAEPYPFAKHPDPDVRARQFLKEYEPIVPSRFTVVIAVTMPYAVRVENNGDNGKGKWWGYNLAVLKYGINRVGNDIFRARPEAAQGNAQYGYIFETNGGRKVVKPNVA